MKLATLDLQDSLYLDKEAQQTFIIPPKTIKSFDSFHNTFFESYWTEYTHVSEISLKLNIQGKCKLNLLRKFNSNKGEHTEVIATYDINSNQVNSYQFDINLKTNTASRIFFEVEAISKVIIENNANWHTRNNPKQEIKLAVITCTFNKQEYIHKNLNNLLSHNDFLESKAEIFVVDNASNLELSKHNKLHYFQQGNFGGAGGFTRGLIEAKQTNRFTHYLFMDDDIELDPDAILRLTAFNSYTKEDYAFSGAMLCLNNKNYLWESGADYLKPKNAFRPKPHFHKRELNTNLLSEISKPYDFEYGGWWFFCFSDKALDKIGFPMPFFIRGDDVEFSIRLNKGGIKNICLPGVGVWHETFTSKTAYWLEYYNFRNYFILTLIHTNFLTFLRRYIKTILHIITSLVFYDYNRARCHLIAISDALKASYDLGKYSNPEHQKKVINAFNKLTEKKGIITKDFVKIEEGSGFDFIARLLTLNAHMLPSNNIDVTVDSKQWKKACLNSQFYYSNVTILGKSTETIKLAKNNKEFWKLLINWIAILVKTFILLHPLKKRFIQIQKETSKISYWKKFLKLT